MGDAMVPLTAPAMPSGKVMRESWETVGAQKRCLTQPRKGFREETWDLRIISGGRVFQAEGTVQLRTS